MKRPLAYFCSVFCFIQFIAFIFSFKTAAALLTGVLFIVFIFGKWNKQSNYKKVIHLLCIASVASLGLNFACTQFYFKPIASYNAETVEVQGYYESILAEEQDGTVRALVRITHVNEKKLLFAVTATVFYIDEHDEGTVFAGKFNISTSSNSSFAVYNTSQGVTATLYPQGVISITGSVTRPQLYFNNIRRQVGTQLRHLLGVKTGVVASAMVVGDETFLTRELEEPFRKSGLSHLLVVSGSHLSMVSYIVIKALDKTRKNIIQKNITSIFFVVILTAFLGFSSSVTRAAIMLIIHLLAPVFGRESDTATTVPFTAFLMVLAKPFIILDVGFLLSVASVSAVLVYSEYTKKEKDEGEKTKSIFNELKEQVLLTIVVTAFILPIISIFGGGVSLFSPIANALVMYLITPLMVTTFITLILSVIPYANIITSFLVIAAKLLVEMIYNVATFFAKLPFGQYYVKGLFPLLCIISIGLIFCVTYGSKEKYKNINQTASIYGVIFLIPVITFYSFYTKNTAQIYVTANTGSIVVIKQNTCVIVYNGTARQTEEISYILQQNNIASCELVINTGNINNEIILRERFFAKEIISVDEKTDFIITPIDGVTCGATTQKSGEIILVQANGYTVATYSGTVSFSGIGPVNALVEGNKPAFSLETEVVITSKENSGIDSELSYYANDTNIYIWVRDEQHIKIHKELF